MFTWVFEIMDKLTNLEDVLFNHITTIIMIFGACVYTSIQDVNYLIYYLTKKLPASS